MLRDGETVRVRVRMRVRVRTLTLTLTLPKPNPNQVSVDGSHLGHNLPDEHGNRYCINLVCVAGPPPVLPSEDVSSTDVRTPDAGRAAPAARRHGLPRSGRGHATQHHSLHHASGQHRVGRRP